jgi:hypothetical protein
MGVVPARKADNLTATYEPIVQKMWKCVSTVWVSTTCYKNSFIFLPLKSYFSHFLF